ncbi:MAG: sulfatase-like hydrolase/transferase [Spirochaetales bacterium]|nr:sulfatase-like hydrolase/transferase [Spirochaetales bacterium]
MGTRLRVIFIMTDTQRTDMVGCYGNGDMHTPHLDRLSSEGIRFDRAYTCQPVCGPARSALFTGTFPHTNGSWGNGMPLGANVKSVGQRLRDTGLTTAYIGKWHLDGGDYFGLGRCPDGWDREYWYDMRTYLEELTPAERRRSRDTTLDPGEVTADFTFGHRCSNRAVDYIRRHRDDDFFLVVSYDEPHDPSICPEPYASMYRDYLFPRSPNVADPLDAKPEHQRIWAGDRLTEGGWAPEIRAAAFFGCNAFIDSEIGRLLEAVDEYADDALVIYTSDHGRFLHSHRLTGKGPAMYEEITRIPLLVRWPSSAPRGVVCSQPVSHIDVVPTVMDFFQRPVPTMLEGRSLLPLFRAVDTRVNEAVFMEFGRYEVDHDGFGGFQPIRACCDGRYKLVINLLTGDELYDLTDDPAEMENLIVSPRYTAVRNALHDRILRWMNETRDPFRGYYWEDRPWRSDRRASSWEYTGMTRQREHEEYEPRQLDYDTGLEMTEAVRKK